MLLFFLATLPPALSPPAGVRTLRLATAADLPSIAQLQLDTFDPAPEASEAPRSMLASLFGSGGGGGGAATRAARAERLTAELSERISRGSDLWVVEGQELDSPLLGTADLSEQEMLLPTHGLADDGLYLSSMAVDAGTRRCGIGRELLRAAEARAVERGADGLWLHVERTNGAALALYEGSGFRKQAATAQYAGFTAALQLAQKEPLLLYKGLAG